MVDGYLPPNSDSPVNIETPAPTVPDDLQIHLEHFVDEETANLVGNKIAAITRELSRYINCSRLDGITISFSYDKALADLDRGITVPRKLEKTSDNAGVGVAITPAVFRNGVVKSHIIFNASHITCIANDDEDTTKQVICLVAHELAHAQDNGIKDIAFPNTMLRQTAKGREGILRDIADVSWSEYIATRLSAFFYPDSLNLYKELFATYQQDLPAKSKQAIDKYRSTGDLESLFFEIRDLVSTFTKTSASVFGSMSSLGLSPDEFIFSNFVDRRHQNNLRLLSNALASMHTTYGTWDNDGVWDELKDACSTCLRDAGIELITTPDGHLYINVP